MIRFLDIERQGTWLKSIQIQVDDVGVPQETQHGLCQVIQATDGVNRPEPLNYFYDDEAGRVEATETGSQWYDVRWVKDKEYFQCRPATAPPEKEFEDNVWEKKDLRITKMSCISSAVKFWEQKDVPDEASILRTAEIFRQYVYGEIE